MRAIYYKDCTPHSYLQNKTWFLKKFSFPFTVSKWIKLDTSHCNSVVFLTFQENIFKSVRPAANSVYNCDNSKGVKFTTLLQLGLSHLRHVKLINNFQDSINYLCNCGHDIEPITPFYPPQSVRH